MLNNYTLDKQYIDIWIFHLSKLPKTIEYILSTLSEDEHSRLHRLYQKEHKNNFMLARFMLRCVIGDYLGYNPATIKFSYNKHGKPQLTQESNLQFNLSHSQNVAVLAIGWQLPLGVDIEFFSARPFKAMATRILSSSELHSFAILPEDLQQLAFFHIWSQKEALAKACGLGLSYPIQQINVPLLPPAKEKIYDKLHNIYWQMITKLLQPKCCIAICCSPNITTINYHTIDLDDLSRIALAWHER